MLFYLTTLNLARFLTKNAPKLRKGQLDIQAISVVDAWKHSDFLCRNYVLNGLVDSLYNNYSDKKTAKGLWESLDRKYKTENIRAKKFIVGHFLDYKMVDSKNVVSQVHERMGQLIPCTIITLTRKQLRSYGNLQTGNIKLRISGLKNSLWVTSLTIRWQIPRMW